MAGKAEVDPALAEGATPLYLAARSGHSEVISWLVAKQAEVDRATQTGATALYIAAHGGHAEAVSRLLAAGAAADQRSVGGTTALHAAVVGCHTEAMGRLLGSGASPRPEDFWVSLLLGNIRGARRLARYMNYSWTLFRSAAVLFGVLFGICFLCWLASHWAAAAAARELAHIQALLPPNASRDLANRSNATNLTNLTNLSNMSAMLIEPVLTDHHTALPGPQVHVNSSAF